MSWAADGQDGNELHPEKMRLILSKFIASVLEKSLKLRLWFIFSWKMHLISSSLFSISISCTTKVLSSNLRQFSPKKPENHHDMTRRNKTISLTLFSCHITKCHQI